MNVVKIIILYYCVYDLLYYSLYLVIYIILCYDYYQLFDGKRWLKKKVKILLYLMFVNNK